MRRVVRAVSVALIVAGTLLVADAGATLIWQEPVTAVIGLIQRDRIDRHYLNEPLSGPDMYTLASLPSSQAQIAFLARRLERTVTAGAAVGQLVIPRIGARDEIVQGTDPASLQAGPGHYPGTALPGLGQTVAIAGHRTTYLAPFRYINELRGGDRLQLRMPYGDFTYAVQHDQTVLPTALWVTNDVGYERLVLSACAPLFSATRRIIVFARLVSVRASAQVDSPPPLLDVTGLHRLGGYPSNRSAAVVLSGGGRGKP